MTTKAEAIETVAMVIALDTEYANKRIAELKAALIRDIEFAFRSFDSRPVTDETTGTEMLQMVSAVQLELMSRTSNVISSLSTLAKSRVEKIEGGAKHIANATQD